jgi:hypothetical protein
LVLIGYSLSGLIAVAILFVGSRFLWDPAGAAGGFGIANSPPISTGFAAWLAVKAGRDMVSGLFVLLLMANGATRLLGEFMLLASLIAIGDAATVLRSGGSRAAAFGIHALTALVIIATGACLILGANA